MHYKLTVDFGNTLVKAAVFQDKQIIRFVSDSELTVSDFEKLVEQLPVYNAISAAVREIPGNILEYLNNKYSHIILGPETSIPVRNLYQTPETLGMDRLAMVVGAFGLFPEKNVLIIGVGTCITYDFVDDKGQYHGGAISPGIHLRLKSLNTFTSKLPLISPITNPEMIGNTTEKAIQSGVMNGILAEIDGFIDYYRKEFGQLKVLVTGGDLNFFKERLKNRIFAIPNLVLTGLNEILDYHIK